MMPILKNKGDVQNCSNYSRINGEPSKEYREAQRELDCGG